MRHHKDEGGGEYVLFYSFKFYSLSLTILRKSLLIYF